METPQPKQAPVRVQEVHQGEGTMTKSEKHELLAELEMGLEKSDCEMGNVDVKIMAVMGVVRKLRTTKLQNIQRSSHRILQPY